ncbi:MAG: GNAT family N-acetyltransferase, partial [Acidisphaera sp.]|nr:GNAT family N-acetyltransferase [Acidisphaera sp.]
VRPAGVADAPKIAALVRLAFAHQEVATDPPPSALRETTETIAAALADGGGAIAERGAEMIGAVLWSEKEGGLYLGRLAVLPSCRGQGVGSALIAAAEAQARALDLARLHLGVRLTLPANRRLFAAHGFVETTRRAHPGYAEPTSVTMEKRLSG